METAEKKAKTTTEANKSAIKIKIKTTPNLQGCGRTGNTSTHNVQNIKKLGTPKNKNHGQSKNHGPTTKRKIIRKTSRGDANEVGFSSEITFYVFTKHPITLNVVLRATEP